MVTIAPINEKQSHNLTSRQETPESEGTTEGYTLADNDEKWETLSETSESTVELDDGPPDTENQQPGLNNLPPPSHLGPHGPHCHHFGGGRGFGLRGHGFAGFGNRSRGHFGHHGLRRQHTQGLHGAPPTPSPPLNMNADWAHGDRHHGRTHRHHHIPPLGFGPGETGRLHGLRGTLPPPHHRGFNDAPPFDEPSLSPHPEPIPMFRSRGPPSSHRCWGFPGMGPMHHFGHGHFGHHIRSYDGPDLSRLSLNDENGPGPHRGHRQHHHHHHRGLHHNGLHARFHQPWQFERAGVPAAA